jgi:asparagine synthase (glutamine-hydrolysing)
MCGIVGVWHLSGNTVREELIEEMRDRLQSRGPDAAGIWTRDGIGFGHRRLAIIDLSPLGNQPMKDPVTGNVVVFNGEIYNFAETRSDLEALGNVFRSDSDTEVLLKAYGQWGERCVHRFVGMFAFAIWDQQRQGLFLARDRLGIKPLYYHHSSRVFLFGSRLGALAPHPWCPRDIDPDALNLYLEIGFVPAPLSIWKGVKKLRPGHTLWLDAQGLRESCYWDLDRLHPDPGLAGSSDDELAERLDILLRDAVKRRLVADVPLGAFLSGGIDSSLVVALMQAVSSRPPKTFTIGFAEPGYDESKYARAIAAHLHTDHHEEIMSARDLLSLLDTNSGHYDEPFADWSSLPTMMVSRFARRHVTVALSGDGGDELFAGYHYYPLLRRFQALFCLPAPIRRGLGTFLTMLPYHPLILAGKALHTNSTTDCFRFMRSMIKDFPRERLISAGATDLRTLFADRAKRFSLRDPVDIATRLDLAYYLPDDILQKVDVASMAFSLEARVPLLDHRVVEFSQSLSRRQKLRHGSTKHLLKKVLARYLPAELFERPKSGFCVPLREWFRGELRTPLLDELSPNRIRAFGFLHPDGVAELINLHLSGKRDTHPTLWTILALFRWQSHIDRIPPASL